MPQTPALERRGNLTLCPNDAAGRTLTLSFYQRPLTRIQALAERGLICPIVLGGKSTGGEKERTCDKNAKGLCAMKKTKKSSQPRQGFFTAKPSLSREVRDPQSETKSRPGGKSS